MVVTVKRRLKLHQRYVEPVADSNGDFHLQPFIPVEQVGLLEWREQLRLLGYDETNTQRLRFFYRVWTD